VFLFGRSRKNLVVPELHALDMNDRILPEFIGIIGTPRDRGDRQPEVQAELEHVHTEDHCLASPSDLAMATTMARPMRMLM
jgi:hypothetical protein